MCIKWCFVTSQQLDETYTTTTSFLMRTCEGGGASGRSALKSDTHFRPWRCCERYHDLSGPIMITQPLVTSRPHAGYLAANYLYGSVGGAGRLWCVCVWGGGGEGGEVDLERRKTNCVLFLSPYVRWEVDNTVYMETFLHLNANRNFSVPGWYAISNCCLVEWHITNTQPLPPSLLPSSLLSHHDTSTGLY